jgi:hypothetical protein
MFGDDSERYIERFEEILADTYMEDLLEEEDLTPGEALYYLFLAGHVKDPFDKR